MQLPFILRTWKVKRCNGFTAARSMGRGRFVKRSSNVLEVPQPTHAGK